MFNIGDEVVCTDAYDDLHEIVGVTGVIMNKHPHSGEFGVKWNKYVDIMHTLDGNCESGYGWYVAPSHLEHVNFTLENE